MKRFLVLIGAVLLVAALASPSLAQFRSWGYVQVESRWMNHLQHFNDDVNDNLRGFAERARLYFQYGDPKTARAVIGFEMDSRAFGEAGGASTPLLNGIHQTSTANANHIGAVGTDQIGVEIKWGYLEFTIPNTPLTVSAGLQTYQAGSKIGQYWLLRDGGGLKATANFAPHALEAFWFREFSNNITTGNDADMYGLVYRLKKPNLGIEAWFGYEDDRRDQVISYNWVTTTTPTPPAGSTNLVLQQRVTARPYQVKPWWIGVDIPMKWGNWSIAPTFVYSGGKAVTDRNTAVAGAPTQDKDYEGWLAALTAEYRIGPGLSALVEGVYITGPDASSTDKEKQYRYPTTSEGRQTIGVGRTVMFFSNSDYTLYDYKQVDPSGIWFARANALYSPLAWLQLSFNYLYYGNTAKDTNRHLGLITGQSNASPAGGNSTNLPGNVNPQFKRYIGQEINTMLTFKIYQNLRYMVGAGYFFAGDVYDTATRSADNAWALRSNIRYTF
ncbi:MAG: hypothetical protein HY697_04975 [Deltaproteobacteria bacterium]|nr:hypothetical protein [Deltaproteobacteria bacterium]